MDTITELELDYLRSQTLGRLATVDGAGTPQNNPVGYRVDDDGTVHIGGLDMANSRKYRNVQASGRAAFVVDDIVSRKPWQVRGVEIRGRAEAQPATGDQGSEIAVHPDRIISWGLDHPVP